ncbi:hypothetical protein DRQ21_10600, partial [Candidatus Fermentibacteria bacterium]
TSSANASSELSETVACANPAVPPAIPPPPPPLPAVTEPSTPAATVSPEALLLYSLSNSSGIPATKKLSDSLCNCSRSDTVELCAVPIEPSGDSDSSISACTSVLITLKAGGSCCPTGTASICSSSSIDSSISSTGEAIISSGYSSSACSSFAGMGSKEFSC